MNSAEDASGAKFVSRLVSFLYLPLYVVLFRLLSKAIYEGIFASICLWSPRGVDQEKYLRFTLSFENFLANSSYHRSIPGYILFSRL